jgi:branched-chain amino acid transport system permease protein
MAVLSDTESVARVETRTRAATLAGLAALVLLALALVLPAFAGRALIQDLFFILTMLALAQFWNLLAGYGGLVSVGQQAFVGIGAYAMFAGVILAGWNPVPAILLGGIAAVALAIPTAFFAFRLQGAYFAIGTWVIAEVTRLSVAQWKTLGGGTGTSLPREATSAIWGVEWLADLFGVRAAAARDILAYTWRCCWRSRRSRASTGFCVPGTGWRWRPCATMPRPRGRWAWMRRG